MNKQTLIKKSHSRTMSKSTNASLNFSSIKEAISELKKGNIIIVTDSEDRENEGDFVIAAEDATPEKINFMATYGRGLICVPIPLEKSQKLELDPMVKNNQDVRRTAFTVSVDAKKGITTGISAYDRSKTIQLLAEDNTQATDFIRPGHIFPLVAKKGGVLVRAGHTEASLDLMKLAGKKETAVICEIMKKDGTMARVPDLIKISKRHQIKMITIASIIEYRRKKELFVSVIADSKLPTKYGEFKIVVFENNLDNKNHIALVKGKIDKNTPVLVRVHSECLTGDIFSSLRCDCGFQLDMALKKISDEGTGILLYMRQEGRGIGIINKIKAYEYQDQGLDTVQANEKLGFLPDLRDYGIGAQILYKLNAHKIRLITNNPRKIIGLEGHGVELLERISLIIKPNKHNKEYLSTKEQKLGHLLNE